MTNKYKYIQVIGFLVVIALLWRIGSAEIAAVTATMVAIWEFIHPSYKG